MRKPRDVMMRNGPHWVDVCCYVLQGGRYVRVAWSVPRIATGRGEDFSAKQLERLAEILERAARWKRGE